ncbi:MAG TPA: hypothetical protein VN761_09140 [Candidatus Polarisedimenticolia bacterium]|nr:hypothetical protein [Candidatus Polarisedimenticolia bacterium]
MKKLLLALGVVVLLAGCCSSGGGMGGSADQYEYHNKTVEYNQGNSYGNGSQM